MMFISVDFPAPFSPAMACTSPRRSSKSTPRSAWIAPNDLLTFGDFEDDLVGHDPRLRTGCAHGRLWRSARRPQGATGAAAAAAQPRPSM